MRVSPLDIRKQEFTRSFRGYEVEEVEAFLQMLSREWEEMRDDHRRLEEQLRSTEDKIRHYERVEEALQEALQTARDSTRKTLQNAEERARLLISKAEGEAQSIKRDAVEQSERMKRENAGLLNRQHEIVARLRAFLAAEMEMLERYQGNELVGSESAEVRSEPPPKAPPAPPARAAASPPQAEKREADIQVEKRDSAAAEGAQGKFNIRSFVRTVESEIDRVPPEKEPLEEAQREDQSEDLSVKADPGQEPKDRGKARQATEEIEKIRRILNDLD